MSSEVKRYDAVHIRYEDNNIRYGEGLGVEMVTARDYDALHADAEALRAQRDKMAQILRDLVPGCKWRIMRPRIDAALAEIDNADE